jgi:hypothetical protein
MLNAPIVSFELVSENVVVRQLHSDEFSSSLIKLNPLQTPIQSNIKAPQTAATVAALTSGTDRRAAGLGTGAARTSIGTRCCTKPGATAGPFGYLYSKYSLVGAFVNYVLLKREVRRLYTHSSGRLKLDWLGHTPCHLMQRV